MGESEAKIKKNVFALWVCKSSEHLLFDRFGRLPRDEQRPEPPPYRNNRMDDARVRTPPPPTTAVFPSRRPADEWHDPWRRLADKNN